MINVFSRELEERVRSWLAANFFPQNIFNHWSAWLYLSSCNMQEILASHHPLQTDYSFQEFGYNFLEKNKNKKKTSVLSTLNEYFSLKLDCWKFPINILSVLSGLPWFRTICKQAPGVVFHRHHEFSFFTSLLLEDCTWHNKLLLQLKHNET